MRPPASRPEITTWPPDPPPPWRVQIEEVVKPDPPSITATLETPDVEDNSAYPARADVSEPPPEKANCTSSLAL